VTNARQLTLMKARFPLGLAALVVLISGVPLRAASPPPNRTNIVFILADDLGYTDLNIFAERITGIPAAQQFYETPNIDRMAREGTAFSQAYACQLCSPTRAGLLTGKFAARIGVTTATPASVRTFYNQGRTPPAGYLANDAIYWGDNIAIQQALLNGSSLDALPSGQPLDQGRDEITIAEALKDYHSAFIGKWHLGGHGAAGWQPHNQGFEELAYVDEGSSPYFNWRAGWDNRKKRFPAMTQSELQAGKAGPDTGKQYLTDSLTETAVQFLRQQVSHPDREPFFLYVCHLAVHGPEQAKPADISHFETKTTRGWNGHSNAVYAAMIKSLDESVGRILETLAQTGLASNTLVVFMSDNGGVTYNHPAATCNAPLKGGKAMLFEGGIRVPLMFHWPGKVKGGQWCEVPVDYTDLFPTLLEFAGYDLKPHYQRIDGRSLGPLLTDLTNAKHGYARDTHYWHYPFNVNVSHPDDGLPPAPHSAIREGDWKLIFDWSGKLYLYDLKHDWREEHDLAEVQPAKTKELFQKLNRWLDQNVAVKYTPLLNPDYNPAKESRARPFVDLRKQLLGEKYAIRAAASDPRIKELEMLKRESTPRQPTGGH
jgi:arylsulfatase A-like enzyme